MDPSAATPTGGPGRLPEMRALMSLRFIAALGVFFLHLTFFYNVSRYAGADTADLPSWMQVLREAYYRQTFFFVLSGFTLAYVYQRMAATLDAARIRRFYRARVARIWPLSALFVLVMLPVQHRDLTTHPLRTLAAMASHLTLTQGFLSSVQLHPHQTFDQAFDAPTWALSCEALAYAVFPVVLWLMVARWKLGNRALAATVLGCWAMIGALGWAFVGASEFTVRQWLYVFPPARIFDFVAGVALGVLFVRLARREHDTAPRTRLAWTAAEAGSILAVVALVAAHWGIPLSLRVSALYFPAAVAIVWVFAHDAGWISRLLSPGWLQYLGRVSFAFYVVHLPVLTYLHKLFGLDVQSPLQAVAAFAACLGVAIACHHVVENPARRAIRARGGRPPRDGAGAARGATAARDADAA